MPLADEPEESLAPIYLPYAWQGAAPQWEIERQFGGASEAIVVQGDIALVGAGPRVLVFDHSQADRGILREIGKSPLLPGIVRDIALDAARPGQATRAVVALGEAGFALLDLSDPARPLILGSGAATEAIDHLVFRGEFAYSGGSLAMAIDLRQASAPRVEAVFGLNRHCGGFRSLELRAGQLWSLECDQLVVYALDDPGHPRPLRSIDLEALLREALPGLLVLNIQAFALDGNTLWLAFSSNAHPRTGVHLAELARIEIEGRPSPAFLSRHPLGQGAGNEDAYCSAPESVAAMGEQVFVRCGRRLVIVDRRRVVDPSELESLTVNPWRFVLVDGGIHYADGDGGYGVLAADPAGHWVERAETRWPGHSRAMAEVDGRLFVAACVLGLQFSQDYQACRGLSTVDGATGRGVFGFAMDESKAIPPISRPDLPALDVGSMGGRLVTVDDAGLSLHEPKADGELALRVRAPLDPAWQRKLAMGGGQITVVDGLQASSAARRLFPVQRFDVDDPEALRFRGTGQLDLGEVGGFEPRAALVAGGELLFAGAGLSLETQLLPSPWPPRVLRSAPKLYRVSLASFDQSLPLRAEQRPAADPPILAAGPRRVALAAWPGLLLFDNGTDDRLDLSVPSDQLPIPGARISALGFAGDIPFAAGEDGELYRIDLEHFPHAVALPIGRVVGKPVSMVFGGGRLWVATAEGGVFGLGAGNQASDLRSGLSEKVITP